MNRRFLIVTGLTALTASGAAWANEDSSLADGEARTFPYQLAPDHPQVNPDAPFWISDPDTIENPRPVMVAGSASGSPADSPANRVDSNVSSSPWAGVASLSIGGSFICSATPVSKRHIVSAGHCFDTNDDGSNDFGTNLSVIFNASGTQSLVISSSGIESVDVHPDYTGFSNPSLNDDIVVITLKEDLPGDIPVYPPFRGNLNQGDVITFVGYGQSGAGDEGYTVGASFFVKRVGANAVDRFFADDEGGPLAELFQVDFDGATGVGPFGGPTLGNDVETTFGGGDSGGPGFIDVTGQGDWELYTVNTFVSSVGGTAAPFFGSGSGGVLITGYLDFLDQFLDTICQLPEDLNGDNIVNANDLAALLGLWGSSDPTADISGDGAVDATDLALLLGDWGASCE